MRKSYLLVLLACLFAVPAFGVPSHENYIGKNDVIGKWMHTYYGSWVPGTSPEGGHENENFYIGRVRPLKRFTNKATQVIQDNDEQIERRMNRKLLWWVPIGELDNGGWTSTPSFSLDAEAFSMWSYITTYGNWTQGFFRQPGAFADACHKNGVLTSVVSTAAWAVGVSSTDGGHGQNYAALINGGADKLLKLMSYYGIDGLGFNSEQSWGDVRSGFKSLMENCHNNKGNYAVGDRLHFDFYQLSDILNATGGGGTDFSDFFPYANGFFLNYNWGYSNLNTSESAATQRGGNSFDVYAGMDQQGRQSADWVSLNSKNISIGLWGAHNKNMIFLGSTEDGSKPEAIQNCYLRKSEQFFTGGTQNPANATNNTIKNVLGTGNASFFGVSQLMAAKSALSWVENGYFPFVSYMNLGAGKVFKKEGEVTFDSEWYNIGMQDHLPTWRWWITKSYMGHSASDVPTDTKATFTYEDAWFGGSCLKVSFENAFSGTSDVRYIQLYKTQFELGDNASDYKMRLRYKVLQGKAVMRYALSAEGKEDTEVKVAMGTLDQTSWTVIEKDLPADLNDATIAQLGMVFLNVAAGTEILIGEVALVKKGVTYNPVVPDIDAERTKVLATTHRGIDFKVIWNCEKPAAASAPIQKATMATVKATIVDAETNMNPYTMDGGSDHTIGTVYDGSTSTFFWSNNSQQNGEYILVDLGQIYDLEKINFYFTSGDQPNGGKMQISTDKSNFTDVKSFTNAELSASSNYLISSSATGKKARYVRFLNDSPNTKVWFQMAEIEVYIVEGSEGGTGVVGPTTGVISSMGAPIYNDEVDTWYYEIWAQQDGKEPQLVTTTTTWAGYAVHVPFDLDGTLSFRAGVRAIAPDGTDDSEIAWSEWMDASTITILEDIVCDKPVIKPNEEFSVYFEDPNHAAGNWVITESATGTVVAEKNGSTIVTFADGLANVGSYDVTIDGQTIPGLIQISPEETGAMPKIYTLTSDKSEIMGNHSEQAVVSYTSRDADGTVSKGLRVGDPNAFVARINDPANNGNDEFAKTAPYTYCMWFKVTDLIHSSQGINLLYKTDFTCDWPQNNWGEFWCQIRPKGTAKSPSGTCLENELSFNVCGWSAHDNARTGMTSGSSLQKGVWYHMAVSLDNDGMERMWINGKLVAESQDNSVYGNGCQSGSNTNSGAFKRKFTRLYVGASGTYKAGFNGVIDEIQCWDKVLSTDEVRTAMRGYQKGSAPENLKGYWTFDEMVSKNINDTARMVFPNWGTGTEEAVGYYSTTPTVNSDGESTLDNLVEKYLGDSPDAGCPILPGQYVVETTPTWSYVGGEGSITPNGYTTTSGSATVSNGIDVNPFRVKLKLENSWGASPEMFVDIVVKDWTVDLEQTVAPKDLTVYPNPFVERISMLFPQEGEYVFAVMNLEGKCVNTQSKTVTAGEVVNMQIDGEAGMYILQIRTKNDVLLQSVKIEKK